MKNKWTEAEVEYIRKHWRSSKDDLQISEALGKSFKATREKRRLIGLKDYETYTPEEDEVLINMKPTDTKRLLAKRLGRSTRSVHNRMYQLGMSTLDGRDGYSSTYLEQCLQMEGYKLGKRFKEKGFPVRTIRESENKKIYTITGEDFWKIVRKNPSIVDLKTYERRTILPEPDDIEELIKQSNYKRIKHNPWRVSEIKELEKMIDEGCSINEMMERLNRTSGSIKNKKAKILKNR